MSTDNSSQLWSLSESPTSRNYGEYVEVNRSELSDRQTVDAEIQNLCGRGKVEAFFELKSIRSHQFSKCRSMAATDTSGRRGCRKGESIEFTPGSNMTLLGPEERMRSLRILSITNIEDAALYEVIRHGLPSHTQGCGRHEVELRKLISDPDPAVWYRGHDTINRFRLSHVQRKNVDARPGQLFRDGREGPKHLQDQWSACNKEDTSWAKKGSSKFNELNQLKLTVTQHLREERRCPLSLKCRNNVRRRWESVLLE
ncbi:hypothetical protein DPMN_058158 [Dreissena polymorpha]|uniref:Uncharacterized protein n=1 Tax=Dreissena polymorpha TaxID=45954 RepID=A0A9D4C182_DREPO|nr:hypothetical protein DPMN_058158 [Dreissena polymorpha]